jgi:hypothetical protein
VSLAEADAEEPIDHQGEWQEGKDCQEDRAAQESGKDCLLAEEERACGDEESKAHAPEVTRDALSARDSAASEHPDVSGRGEQEDDAEEKAHGGRSAFVGGRVMEGLDTERDDGGCSADADEKRGPVKRSCNPAAAGKPGGGDQVECDDAADDVTALGFQDREVKAAGGQRQHRDAEHVSRGAMQTVAFADGHSDGAGEQANRATEDVQNQEGESQASTSFQHLPLRIRL